MDWFPGFSLIHTSFRDENATDFAVLDSVPIGEGKGIALKPLRYWEAPSHLIAIGTEAEDQKIWSVTGTPGCIFGIEFKHRSVV